MLSHRRFDPYDGLAASIVTSHVIDTRAADRFTLSVRTSSGTSSVLSYEVSNSTLGIGDIDANSWSHVTLFGLVSGKTVLQPIVGAAWARVIRTVSNASYILEAHIQERA